MATKPTYDFIPSPNFGRRTVPITAIVIHYTEANSIDGTISWFKNPASKVSSHYLVGRDGRVVQMVRDEDVAWHAGVSAMNPYSNPPSEPNVNKFSIGIELVGTHDSGFTDRELASLYELIQLLVVKYKIKPERVVGHKHIAPGRKLDPDGYDNQFPWAKVMNLAQMSYSTIPDIQKRQAETLNVQVTDSSTTEEVTGD